MTAQSSVQGSHPPAKTGPELVREAKAAVEALNAPTVERVIGAEPVTVVDVRETHEWSKGHLPGAVHVPRGHLEMQIEAKLPDKETPLLVYCAGGVRSAFAANTLKQMGYSNVRHMSGGFTAWRDLGFEVIEPKVWSDEQLDRYSRHFILPEVGEEGQQKISNGKVLVIGAGGLGAPVLYYLAAAGVGTLGVVDFDDVEASNLQRQIIHTTSRIGVNKAQSAKEAVEALNPDVTVKTWTKPLSPDNVDSVIEGFDVVIDATDNFPTRYLVNAAAFAHGIPCIYGSIYRFEGYASVFWPARGGPCYRCMHPEAPPKELAPSCGEAGVLGVLPGIVGVLQANEALKILVGYGEPLVGRILAFDAQDTHFNEFNLHRNSECATCGDRNRAAGEYESEIVDACAAPGALVG